MTSCRKRPPPRLPRDLAHLAGPVLALAAVAAMPALLDPLVPALFLGYGVAIRSSR